MELGLRDAGEMLHLKIVGPARIPRPAHREPDRPCMVSLPLTTVNPHSIFRRYTHAWTMETTR